MKSVSGLASLLLVATPAFGIGHWQGAQRGLVLPLEWANRPAVVDVQTIHNTMFSDDPASASARMFFKENSQGKFDLTGDVLPWKRTQKNWASESGCSLVPIVNAALTEFRADIDVSLYDADHNGKIDNLFIVHSGRINKDRVGPECTFTTSPAADHTIVFQSQGLGSVGDAIPIGFYIHEAGHGYFNFPDLYGDHYNGKYGIGMWGMMGLGAWGTNNDTRRADFFRYPSHFEPLNKVQIGWVKPRVISQTTTNVVIKPVEESNDIVAVPTRDGSNFYLEYRSGRGFSEGHKGQGLLIWKNYKLVQADGRDDLNHGNALGRRPLPPIAENFGDDSDPFPGSLNVTSYEDRAAGIRFENIRLVNDQIELDIITKNANLKYRQPIFDVFDGIERL